MRQSSCFRPPFSPSGGRILVAVSGGPDSLCLLHVLLALRGDLGLDAVEAAHLDHGLRGADSAADAAFVADFCASHGVPCVVGSADVAGRASADGLSIQAAARRERYAFLERVARERGLERIVVAHTRDDQIETILLNLLRGTGLDGLRGMAEVNAPYMRPLLGATRDDVEAYCASRGLAPRRDPTNDDPEHYARNRVRLELLPALRRCRPAAGEAVLRLGRTAADAADYLDAQAAAAFDAAIVSQGPDELTLDGSALRALHPALRTAVVRLAIRRVRATLEDVGEGHIRAVLGFLESGRLRTITTPKPQAVVAGSQAAIRFARPARAALIASFAAVLPDDGIVTGPNGLWIVGWEACEPPPDLPEGATYRASVDTACLSGPLIVRSRQAGDRIDPVGMRGHRRKLQDVFVDAKIPKGQRDLYPVVCDTAGPIWLPGLVLSGRAAGPGGTPSQAVLRAWIARTDRGRGASVDESGSPPAVR